MQLNKVFDFVVTLLIASLAFGSLLAVAMLIGAASTLIGG